MAEAEPFHPQASYHGINVAFMTVAYRHDHAAARELAARVLYHCEQAKLKSQRQLRGKKDVMWRHATEGEAQLILGKPSAAIESYRSAVRFDPAPTPRELDSMYQQAIYTVGLIGSQATARKLEELFRAAH